MKTRPKQTNLIKFSDVKAALLDERFRDTLPPEMTQELQKFLSNPGCACNAPIYRKILKEYPDQIRKYFPLKEYITPEEEDDKLAKNMWSVINCHASELESKMRSLHKAGRKQIAIARYEDQVTLLINELDVVF